MRTGARGHSAEDTGAAGPAGSQDQC
jgi:hypothetical protein